MNNIPWLEAPRGTTHYDPVTQDWAKVVGGVGHTFVRGQRTGYTRYWSRYDWVTQPGKWVCQGALSPEQLQRLIPKPVKIGVLKGTQTFKVRCVGGPWDKQDMVVPKQCDGNPMSLPINVPGFSGRYDLNSGVWRAGL